MLLHNFLDFHARDNGALECVIQDDRVLNYTQMSECTSRLANAFFAAGLGVGDRFALLSKNSIEMVIVYLAASKVGAVPVPLNWRLAPLEWVGLINNAEAKLLIAQSEFSSAVDSVRSDMPALNQTIVIGSQQAQSQQKPGWIDFDNWWINFPAEAPPCEVCEDDVLYQMYTSGTTGRPKGAMLTQRAVITNAVQCIPVFSGKLRLGKRTLIVMPMFHAGAASFVFGSLLAGATMIIHSDFSPEHLAAALSEQRINMVNLVPAMIQAMLINVPDLAQRSYSNLEVVVYGASAIAEDTLQRAMEVFQCDFYQGYGQTESSAVVSFLSAADHRRALQNKPKLLLSAGRALVGTTLKIVDKKGRELPRGEVGEIVARGPQVMKGYWKLPEATDTALVNDWLHTGDAAYMDEEGYIYIQDRVKDMVISGGENIYPREIENVLFDHPAIVDAAVIGVPDAKYGEALMAIVVPRNGEKLEACDIIAYCRTKLGGYKVPRQFSFVDELPRNPSGKILKQELRAPYWPQDKRSI